MASDPLTQIREQIGQAKSLPEPRPYAPDGQPMDRLLRLIDDARSGRDPAESQPASAAAPSSAPTAQAPAAAPPGSLDAVVGQQILASLESRSLSGEARAETVRRLALAMQNPTRQNLQSVLDVLLTGDPSTGQTRQ